MLIKCILVKKTKYMILCYIKLKTYIVACLSKQKISAIKMGELRPHKLACDKLPVSLFQYVFKWAIKDQLGPPSELNRLANLIYQKQWRRIRTTITKDEICYVIYLFRH